MKIFLNTTNNQNFGAIRGKLYQNYSSKQENLIDNLEKNLNERISKNSGKSYMQELESRNIDLYVKPANEEDSIKLSLVKKSKKHGLYRLCSLGVFNDKDEQNLPRLILSRTKQYDSDVKPSTILAGIALVMGLMALVYALPQRNLKQSLETVKDSITLVKDSLKVVK